MFVFEAAYQDEKRSRGIHSALSYYAGIATDTRFHGAKDGTGQRGKNTPKPTRKEKLKQQETARPSLLQMRVVLDLNEHFLEMSSAGEERRSLIFMLMVPFGFVCALLDFQVVGDLFSFLRGHAVVTSDWKLGILIGCVSVLLSTAFFYLFWLTMFAPAFFTALRARYRFNRTTRRVYVLRPKKYGGNAILDWDRVQAHVNWTPPSSWTPSEIANDPAAREARALKGAQVQNLLLYWPPLDAGDPERDGEDILWVGEEGAGESLWQYIRTYMEEGMNSVPRPGVDNWLRKGFSGASEHLEETVMHRSHASDDLAGSGTSTGTYVNYAANLPWAPLHSLAERLCYWPTFPEEWNGDCGQKRRESGIGPEEPLWWAVKQ